MIKLNNEGHTIGLHSHNHPTKLEEMNYQEQLNEYSDNLNNLKLIIGDPLIKLTQCLIHVEVIILTL